jgi:hypothetical protein
MNSLKNILSSTEDWVNGLTQETALKESTWQTPQEKILLLSAATAKAWNFALPF